MIPAGLSMPTYWCLPPIRFLPGTRWRWRDCAPRKRPVSWGIFCWVILWTLLATVPAFAREVPERDPRDGALDASLIVLVRQEEPEVFRIEEVFLGEKEAGATIRLAKFRLYTIQEDGPEKIDTIMPQTRILLFLKPKKETPATWEIPGYGYCFFWVHNPTKVVELRKMAQDMVILRKSWEKARNISDPRQRVEALWPFLWERNARVKRLTSEELKNTAPVAGDFIAERFHRLRDRERQQLVLDAADYGGKNLHGVLHRYLQDLQRRYEIFLKDRGSGAEKLIEKWNDAPQEVTEISGCLYYGLAGLVKYKNRDDLPYIRELTAWAVKYRFKDTCDAALNGFKNMPDRENLPLINAAWREFSRHPYEGDPLLAIVVSRAYAPIGIPKRFRFSPHSWSMSLVGAKSSKPSGKSLAKTWATDHKRGLIGGSGRAGSLDPEKSIG